MPKKLTFKNNDFYKSLGLYFEKKISHEELGKRIKELVDRNPELAVDRILNIIMITGWWFKLKAVIKRTIFKK